MKAINESKLDEALRKLETIKFIANDFIDSSDPLVCIISATILEVIDE